MRRTLVASATVLALVAGAASGCGGGSTVTKTLTTTGTPTTAPAVTAAIASTAAGAVTAPPASTTAAGTIGADRLPPEDAIGSVQSGVLRQLGDAQAFVDALYRSGDPTKTAAVSRLRASGYAGGALRDQVGEDTTSGIALFRTYAFRLRDEAGARAEVTDAIEEVRTSTTEPTKEIDLGDLPGAEGLHVDVAQGDVTGAVAFVSFSAGPYVYGLQGISTDDAALPEAEIVAAARDLYEKVTAAP